MVGAENMFIQRMSVSGGIASGDLKQQMESDVSKSRTPKQPQSRYVEAGVHSAHLKFTCPVHLSGR